MVPKIKVPGDSNYRVQKKVNIFKIDKSMTFGSTPDKPKQQEYKDVRSMMIGELQKNYGWKK